MTRFKTPTARARIADLRQGLRLLGFKAAASKGRLPGFDRTELWAHGHHAVYLAWTWAGRWDVVAPICDDLDVGAVFEALEAMLAA